MFACTMEVEMLISTSMRVHIHVHCLLALLCEIISIQLASLGQRYTFRHLELRREAQRPICNAFKLISNELRIGREKIMRIG